jgi:hypothetical protein
MTIEATMRPQPDPEVWARVARAERSAGLAKGFAYISGGCAFTTGLALIVCLCDRARLPDGISPESRGGRHQVDLILRDGVMMDDQEIDEVLKPMLMVSAVRMPTQFQHLRIIISPSGFPIGADQPLGTVASYVTGEDYFTVDAAMARTPLYKGVSRAQTWAFAMAHEAAHLWQARRSGTMPDFHSYDPSTYERDPLEIEAFTEGTSAASSLPGTLIVWRLGRSGRMITPREAVRYSNAARLRVREIADVRVHRQYTVRGTLQRLKDAFLRW